MTNNKITRPPNHTISLECGVWSVELVLLVLGTARPDEGSHPFGRGCWVDLPYALRSTLISHHRFIAPYCLLPTAYCLLLTHPIISHLTLLIADP